MSTQTATKSSETKRSKLAPVDNDGKLIPHSHRWTYGKASLSNIGFRSNTTTVVFVAAFLAFNHSKAGHAFYTHLHNKYGDFNVNVWATFIITSTFFWLWASIFALADLTSRPRWLFKYKTQPFTRVTGREYAWIALISLRNQVLVALPLAYISGLTIIHPVQPPLPSVPVTLFTIAFNILCTEIGFYYVHRLFHTPSLYARFHKKHHTFTAPVGLASTYCTLTEHLCSNLLPNVIGFLIIPHHWSTMVFTLLLLEFGTICTHSGYNIPWLPSNLQHDFHHFAFDENFGPMGLLDGIHGTNGRFKKTMDAALSRTDGDAERARAAVLERLAQLDN